MPLASQSNARERQGELGQFLTPAPVAGFMASIFGPLPPEVRLLDAGAGSGSLTKAFVARICGEPRGKRTVKSIHATLYEVDSSIIGILSNTSEECRLMGRKKGQTNYFTSPQ